MARTVKTSGAHEATHYDGGRYYKYFFREAVSVLSIINNRLPEFKEQEKHILAGKAFLLKSYISYTENFSPNDVKQFWSFHFLGRFLSSVYSSIGLNQSTISVYDILPFPLVSMDLIRELMLAAKEDFFKRCVEKRNDDNEVVYSLEAERSSLLEELSLIADYLENIVPLHRKYLMDINSEDTIKVSEKLVSRYINFLDKLKAIRDKDEKYDKSKTPDKWTSPLVGHLLLDDVSDAMCERLQSKKSSTLSESNLTAVNFKEIEEALMEEDILFLCLYPDDDTSSAPCSFPFGYRGIYEKSNKELFFGSVSFSLFYIENAGETDMKYACAYSMFLSLYLKTSKALRENISLDNASFDLSLMNEASILVQILEKRLNDFCSIVEGSLKDSLDSTKGENISPKSVFSHVFLLIKQYAGLLPKHNVQYYANIQNTRIKELSIEMINICMEHIASNQSSKLIKKLENDTGNNRQEEERKVSAVLNNDIETQEIKQGEENEQNEEYENGNPSIAYTNDVGHSI